MRLKTAIEKLGRNAHVAPMWARHERFQVPRGRTRERRAATEVVRAAARPCDDPAREEHRLDHVDVDEVAAAGVGLVPDDDVTGSEVVGESEADK